MGLLDGFRKKPEENSTGQKPAENSGNESIGKFAETCAICGKGPTDVKWMGQYWHVRCKRAGKKMAKRMV